MKIGYKLATESLPPKEIIRQAVPCEQASFDLPGSVALSPAARIAGHCGFTWGLLPVIAAKTGWVGLLMSVTCLTVRYHPAVIAWAAAPLAIVPACASRPARQAAAAGPASR